MGNCVHSSSGGCHGASRGEGGGRPVRLQRRRSGGEQAGAAPAVKVKMVLTKGELGWLVARLKAGDRRLEGVLHEMARRKRVGRDGWRPSLESIVECPAETAAAAGSDS